MTNGKRNLGTKWIALGFAFPILILLLFMLLSLITFPVMVAVMEQGQQPLTVVKRESSAGFWSSLFQWLWPFKEEELVSQWWWPVDNHFVISSGFGDRVHPITGQKGFHAGIDIPGKEGTIVTAVAEGTVLAVGNDGALGTTVRIRHRVKFREPDGSDVECQFESVYGHLQEGSLQVDSGEPVFPGKAIGRMGNTGASTGSHLHFELRRFVNSSVSIPMNPEPFFIETAMRNKVAYEYTVDRGKSYSGEYSCSRSTIGIKVLGARLYPQDFLLKEELKPQTEPPKKENFEFENEYDEAYEKWYYRSPPAISSEDPHDLIGKATVFTAVWIEEEYQNYDCIYDEKGSLVARIPTTRGFSYWLLPFRLRMSASQGHIKGWQITAHDSLEKGSFQESQLEESMLNYEPKHWMQKQ